MMRETRAYRFIAYMWHRRPSEMKWAVTGLLAAAGSDALSAWYVPDPLYWALILEAVSGVLLVLIAWDCVRHPDKREESR